jgi:hypothetical protein
MALSRYNATTGLLHGTRQGKENVDGILGKPGAVKSGLTTRGALGNISNASKVHSAVELKKGLKDTTNVVKPSRVLSKQAQAKNKENVGSQLLAKQPEKEERVPSPIAETTKEAAFSKQLMAVQDIDKDDHDNPQLVSEYVNSIYDYMRALERQFPIRVLLGEIVACWNDCLPHQRKRCGES